MHDAAANPLTYETPTSPGGWRFSWLSFTASALVAAALTYVLIGVVPTYERWFVAGGVRITKSAADVIEFSRWFRGYGWLLAWALPPVLAVRRRRAAAATATSEAGANERRWKRVVAVLLIALALMVGASVYLYVMLELTTTLVPLK